MSHNWESRGKAGSRHGDQRSNDGIEDPDSFHFSALRPSKAVSPVVAKWSPVAIRVHASLFITIRGEGEKSLPPKHGIYILLFGLIGPSLVMCPQQDQQSLSEKFCVQVAPLLTILGHGVDASTALLERRKQERRIWVRTKMKSAKAGECSSLPREGIPGRCSLRFLPQPSAFLAPFLLSPSQTLINACSICWYCYNGLIMVCFSCVLYFTNLFRYVYLL